MSMCICDKCGDPIDSDNDPDCFVEVGNMRRMHKTEIICEACRDKMDIYETADEPCGPSAHEVSATIDNWRMRK